MQRPEPRNEEIVLDPKRYIVSKTDASGVINYANDYFIEVSGYTERELIGQPHNIIRHPDMPKLMYKMLWEALKSGKEFKLIMKNLSKDGRFYWVVASFETNRHARTDEILGYTAYRKAIEKHVVEKIAPIYKRLCNYEQVNGVSASERYFTEILNEKKMVYAQFVEDMLSHDGISKLFKKMFH